jgi:hypothetical protein
MVGRNGVARAPPKGVLRGVCFTAVNQRWITDSGPLPDAEWTRVIAEALAVYPKLAVTSPFLAIALGIARMRSPGRR